MPPVPVRRLDLFGSAAGDDFDPARSDLDFLVEFERGAPWAFKTYFGFKELLRRYSVVGSTLLSRARFATLLQREIERSREPIFEA